MKVDFAEIRIGKSEFPIFFAKSATIIGILFPILAWKALKIRLESVGGSFKNPLEYLQYCPISTCWIIAKLQIWKSMLLCTSKLLQNWVQLGENWVYAAQYLSYEVMTPKHICAQTAKRKGLGIMGVRWYRNFLWRPQYHFMMAVAGQLHTPKLNL